MGIALEVAGTPCFRKAKFGDERRDGLPVTIPIFCPREPVEVSARRHDLPDIKGACRSPDTITVSAMKSFAIALVARSA